MDEGQSSGYAAVQASVGPYRRPSPGLPPPEAEEQAAAELTKRASRVRTFTIVPCVLLGLATGIAGYWALRELQFQIIGAHVPWLTGAVGIGVPFGGGLQAARRLSDGLVRWRRGAWVRQIASRYGLPEERLEEYGLLL